MTEELREARELLALERGEAEFQRAKVARLERDLETERALRLNALDLVVRYQAENERLEAELEAERRETARLRAATLRERVEALVRLGAVEVERDEALRAVETFEALARDDDAEDGGR